VAVNEEYVGRTFEAAEPYEVTRGKIAEFAQAIGDSNRLYTDQAAAQAAGYPDVIAPPTFPIVVTTAANRLAVQDPGLGLNYAMVVHGEQQFRYSRPLHAGDVVIAQSTITRIRRVKSLTMLTTETQIRSLSGEHICTGLNTLVERGEA
jgi:acyl dehydratase